MAWRTVEVEDEVPRGNWVRWTNPGESRVGIYQGKAAATSKEGKPKTDYMFKDHDGLYTITANYDLNRRMTKALVEGLKAGHLVKVTYVKDAAPYAEGQSPMKVFSVAVDPDYKPKAAAPQPPPADDDLPF